jgi:hypothetical protein
MIIHLYYISSYIYISIISLHTSSFFSFRSSYLGQSTCTSLARRHCSAYVPRVTESITGSYCYDTSPSEALGLVSRSGTRRTSGMNSHVTDSEVHYVEM